MKNVYRIPAHSWKKNHLFSQEYSLTELDMAIQTLKYKKSPGSDKICPDFIKNLSKKAKLLLLNMLNKMEECHNHT